MMSGAYTEVRWWIYTTRSPPVLTSCTTSIALRQPSEMEQSVSTHPRGIKETQSRWSSAHTCPPLRFARLAYHDSHQHVHSPYPKTPQHRSRITTAVAFHAGARPSPFSPTHSHSQTAQNGHQTSRATVPRPFRTRPVFHFRAPRP